MRKFLISLSFILLTAIQVSATMVNPYLQFPVVSAAAAWLPTDIAGCAGWWDMADASTVLTSIGPDTPAGDGDNIRRVNDKSGNSNHLNQSTAADQPTYNITDSVADFDDDYVTVSATTVQAFFFVLKNVAGSSQNTNFAPLQGDSTDNTEYFFLLKQGGGSYTLSLDGNATGYTGDMTIDGNALIPGDGTGTNIDYQEGGDYSPFPLEPTTYRILFYRFESSFTSNEIMGMTAGATLYKSNAELAECIVYSGDVATANRQKVEGYLAHEWGIESQLPAGHPYKSSPP